MVNYKCIRCGYDTTDKSKIKSHLNRKTVCKPILNDVNLEDYKDKILNCQKIILENDAENHAKTAENHAKLQENVILNVNKCNPSAKVLSTICNQNVNNIDFPVNEMSTNVNTNNVCEFCKKVFSSRQGKWKHLKTCKEKKKDDEEKSNLLNLVDMLNQQLNEHKEQMKQKDEQMKKKDHQIDELIKKAGITQNIQNNIKLVAYKDTDLSHLTDKDYLQCLNRSNMVIPNLIKRIHFNPKKPENQNIYISNIKNKYVMIYDGGKWNLHNREDTIDDLIDTNEIVIEQKLEEWMENGKEYPDIMKKFNRYLEKKEKDQVKNAIKEEIKLILFNNRKTTDNKKIDL